MTSITEVYAPRSSVVYRVLNALRETADSFSRARAAADEYEVLSRLSDKQLEARGLDRDSIAQSVMTRHFDI